jgi:uncharacterized membrane protein
MEIVLALLAIVGFIGYVILNLATKEPSPPHRDAFLAIYGFTLVLMVIAGLFIEWPIEFSWQDTTSFYAIYGFSACIFLIYVAKGLRLFLPREEDYYEKKGGRDE